MTADGHLNLASFLLKAAQQQMSGARAYEDDAWA